MSYSVDDISYDSLISKPDMRLTDIYDTIKAEDRRIIVEEGIKDVSNNGGITSDERTFTYVDDIEAAVFVSKASLSHGLDRRRNIQSTVTKRVGDILKNSILINKAAPKIEAASESFILLGAGKANGGIYTTAFVVNRFTSEVEAINILRSANVKITEAAVPSTRASGKPLSLTASKISIANLFNIVNEQFADVHPANALEHFGTGRRTIEIYKICDTANLSSRQNICHVTSAPRVRMPRLSL